MNQSVKQAKTSPFDLPHLLDVAKQIATGAGQALLRIQQEQSYRVESKEDGSPVTSADIYASDLITQQLRACQPSFPVLTEEALPSWQHRQQWHTYWLVDPLDGTQEFIYGSADFAVSIALVHQGKPVIGVIYWPQQCRLYYAAQELGAWRQKAGQQAEAMRIKAPDLKNLTIALSTRQPKERIFQWVHEPYQSMHCVHRGSCALKACMVAEGTADCYVRLGETGEWDTGAAEVIVGEAGGSIVSTSYQPLSYNQEESTSNPDFLILGSSEIPWTQVFSFGEQVNNL